MTDYRSLVLLVANNSETLVKKLIDDLLRLPNTFALLIAQVIFFMLYLFLFIGLLLIIWGLLEWLSGWNETSGKRNFIKGVIMTLIAVFLGIMP